jgi:aldehyde:ferredoxin oxidoreductase
VLVPGSYEKARAVVFYQDVYTLADALEICKFTTSHNGQGTNIKDMAELFSAATGIDLDEKEMRTIADRIYNLERAYLAREGIHKQDDFFQGKWALESVQSGPFKGEFIDQNKWEKMLEDYYELRGWDKNTGIPTKGRLKALGLNEVVEELEKMGKYK